MRQSIDPIQIRSKSWLRAVVAAFPSTIPVLTGFLVLGIAYGILMQTKGFGPVWAGLMSAIAFCGSMQFVAITLLTTAFDPLQAFLLSFLVNARHMFYGLSMLQKYHDLGWRKGACVSLLCDETFSLLSTYDPPEGIEPGAYYTAISVLNWSYWVLGSVLGGLLSNVLTFNTTGMDFALTALFLVLFLERLDKRENRPAAVIGVFAAAVCLWIFGQANLVIPSMVLILVILLMGRKKLCH